MQLAYPFRLDGAGRIAQTDEATHVRDLIEQVLFTSPGERVNRPEFGSGLLRMVFAPAGDAMAAATQATVQAALQRWLGELIELTEVDVSTVDTIVRVRVGYRIRRTGDVRTELFERGGVR